MHDFRAPCKTILIKFGWSCHNDNVSRKNQKHIVGHFPPSSDFIFPNEQFCCKIMDLTFGKTLKFGIPEVDSGKRILHYYLTMLAYQQVSRSEVRFCLGCCKDYIILDRWLLLNSIRGVRPNGRNKAN